MRDIGILDRKLTIVLLALLVAVALVASWRFGESVSGFDYYQFWVVGEAVEHDSVSNIYSDHERARIGALFRDRAIRDGSSDRLMAVANARSVLETYSTPFLYLALHLLASGDYETDLRRWHALSLFAFVAGVMGMCHLFGYTGSIGLALLLALLLWFEPLQSEIRVVNVNSVQLGLLAFILALLRKGDDPRWRTAAGIALGVATMFKPNLILISALLLPGLALLGRRREALLLGGGLVVGAGLAIVSSSFFFGGLQCWSDWIRAVGLIPPEIISFELGNIAPLFAFGDDVAAGVSPLVAGIMIAVTLWALSSSQKGVGEEAMQLFLVESCLVAMGCVTYLLSSTLVWEHYFILAIPMLLFALRPRVGRPPVSKREILLERVLPGAALLGLMAIPTRSLLQSTPETYLLLAQAPATLILLGLGLWHFRSPEREALGSVSRPGASWQVRAGVAVALLLTMALLHPLSWLKRRDGMAAARTVSMRHYIEMLSESETLRDRLRSVEVIGYESGAPIDTRTGGIEQLRYYLAQFALTPTVAQLGGDHEFILGNFTRPEDLAEYARRVDRKAAVLIAPTIALLEGNDTQ